MDSEKQKRQERLDFIRKYMVMMVFTIWNVIMISTISRKQL